MLFGMLALAGLHGALAAVDKTRSGGEGTVDIFTDKAFSEPAANLPMEELARFFAGNAFFNTNWVAATSSAEGRDGLGPLFNVRSCSACHFKDGRGEAPDAGEQARSLLIRVSRPGQSEVGGPLLDPVYGEQISPQALPGLQPEAKIDVTYERISGQYPDGRRYQLRKPTYTLSEWAYGEPEVPLLASPRITPAVIGLGLLDAVAVADILAGEDPDDADGDGISGRANYVWSIEKQERIMGRYGWKANKATLNDQTAGAFHGDLGITSTLIPHENHGAALAGEASGGTPEIEDIAFGDVVFYLQALAVPARRDVDDPQVMHGEMLFTQVDCARCHTPEMTTADKAEFAFLERQTIRPYTDMLLHDMGPELADGRPDFEASGSEWRTPPLWGMGLYETVNGHRHLMHDGRARTLEEAILWHGGEAARSREKFMSLPKSDRDNLIAFLESL